MTKQAIIYTRVSTEEQGKGYSLSTQVDSCLKHAANQNYVVVKKFSDKFSGTALERPGLNKMLKFVTENKVDVLIVHDLDRLSRGGPGHLAIIEMELEKSEVAIEAVLGSYDDSPEGELNRVIKSAIAQYENRHRVERSRRGKIGRARAGYVMTTANRAPYGYDYKSEDRKGWFVVNEKEAEVVKQIFAWLIEDGHSCYEIAKKLHEIRELTRGDMYEGVAKKAGAAAWSPSTIRRIVRNETYKGTWYYGKTRTTKVNGKSRQRAVPKSEWIPVPVPSIIDEETWDKAQQCLAKNKQNARRNTKRAYLLKGLVFCACGRRWCGRYKNHLDRAYYRCPKSEKEKWMSKCTMPGGIRQEALEEAVWTKISEVLLSPEFLRTELGRLENESQSEAKRLEDRLKIIDDALSEVRRKMGILLDQMLTDGFVEEVIEDRKRLLIAQQKDLENERQRLANEAESIGISAEQVETLVTFAKKMQSQLGEATFEVKRQVLEILQIRIDVVNPQLIKLSAMIPVGEEGIEIPAHPRSRTKNNGPVVNMSPG